jgi:hypothetical protein
MQDSRPAPAGHTSRIAWPTWPDDIRRIGEAIEAGKPKRNATGLAFSTKRLGGQAAELATRYLCWLSGGPSR